VRKGVVDHEGARDKSRRRRTWEVVNPETDNVGRYTSCYMCLRVYPRPDGSPILWVMAEEIGEEDGVSVIHIYFNQSHQYGKVYIANEQQVQTEQHVRTEQQKTIIFG